MILLLLTIWEKREVAAVSIISFSSANESSLTRNRVTLFETVLGQNTAQSIASKALCKNVLIISSASRGDFVLESESSAINFKLSMSVTVLRCFSD